MKRQYFSYTKAESFFCAHKGSIILKTSSSFASRYLFTPKEMAWAQNDFENHKISSLKLCFNLVIGVSGQTTIAYVCTLCRVNVKYGNV